MGDAGPSLPPNYVSLLHLKQRWLQQQQQSSDKSTPPHHLQSDSSQTSVVKPQNEDSASKVPNEVRTNCHQVKPHAANEEEGVNQLKPDDSADSKTPKEAVRPRGRNHRRRVVNQLKPEVTVQHDSASKTAAVQVAEDTGQSNTRPSTKRRNRNPRFVTDRNQTVGSTSLLEPEPESVQEKKQIDNHPVVENNTNRSNSKPSTKNKSSRGRNPRFVADQNQTEPESVEEEKKEVDNRPVVEKQEQSSSKVSKTKGSYRIRNPRDQIPTVGSTTQSEPESVEQGHATERSNSTSSRNRNPRVVTDQITTGDSTPEPEAVKEKKHSRYSRNRNQEVWEEKAVAEDLKERNDSGGAVKEVNVSHGNNKGWRGSGRFQGRPRNGPPHFRVKGQRRMTTGVWVVKKGESAPN